MLIEWLITDPIANITLNDFIFEEEALYGFIKTTLFSPPLGYIPNKKERVKEGNSDIVYWMSILVETGIAIKYKTNYSFKLLSYNMLEVSVACRELVEISLNSVSEHKLISYAQTTYNNALKEIVETVSVFIAYIDKINPSLLKSKKLNSIIKKLEELN